MVKYILFDLDGTLTDPKVGITKAVQYALRKFGIEVADTDELCPFIGPPLRASFEKFCGMDEENAEKAIGYYREYFSEKGIYENTIYDGIEALLYGLKERGKIMILATSKPTVYAEKILKYFHIEQYFTYVSGSELDGRRTEKSEVIAYALEQNGILDLSEVIMIGDREYDILGAKEVGVRSIGVLYGYASLLELANAKADIIVKDVHELGEELYKF